MSEVKEAPTPTLLLAASAATTKPPSEVVASTPAAANSPLGGEDVGPGMWINAKWFVSKRRKILKRIGKIYLGLMLNPRQPIWIKVLKRAVAVVPNGKTPDEKPVYESSPLRETAAFVRYLANFLGENDLCEIRARTIHVFRAVQNDRCLAVFLEPLGQELTSSRLARRLKADEKLCRVVVLQMLRVLQILEKADTSLVDVGEGRNWAVQNADSPDPHLVRVKVVSLKLETALKLDPVAKEVFYGTVLFKFGVLVYRLLTGRVYKGEDVVKRWSPSRTQTSSLSTEAKSFVNSLLALKQHFLEAGKKQKQQAQAPTAGGGSPALPKRPTITEMFNHPWLTNDLDLKLLPAAPFVELLPVEKIPVDEIKVPEATGKLTPPPAGLPLGLAQSSSKRKSSSGGGGGGGADSVISETPTVAQEITPPGQLPLPPRVEAVQQNPTSAVGSVQQCDNPTSPPHVDLVATGVSSAGETPFLAKPEPEMPEVPSTAAAPVTTAALSPIKVVLRFRPTPPRIVEMNHPLDVAFALAQELVTLGLHGNIRMNFNETTTCFELTERSDVSIAAATQHGDVVDFALHVLFRAFHEDVYDNIVDVHMAANARDKDRLIRLVRRVVRPSPEGSPRQQQQQEEEEDLTVNPELEAQTRPVFTTEAEKNDDEEGGEELEYDEASKGFVNNGVQEGLQQAADLTTAQPIQGNEEVDEKSDFVFVEAVSDSTSEDPPVVQETSTGVVEPESSSNFFASNVSAGTRVDVSEVFEVGENDKWVTEGQDGPPSSMDVDVEDVFAEGDMVHAGSSRVKENRVPVPVTTKMMSPPPEADAVLPMNEESVVANDVKSQVDRLILEAIDSEISDMVTMTAALQGIKDQVM